MDLDDAFNSMKARSKKERVFEYLDEYPTVNTKGLYHRFPNMNKITLRAYLKEYKDKHNVFSIAKDDILVLWNVMTYKMKAIQQLKRSEQESLERIRKWLNV